MYTIYDFFKIFNFLQIHEQINHSYLFLFMKIGKIYFFSAKQYFTVWFYLESLEDFMV